MHGRRNEGSALIITLLSLAILSALGVSLVLNTIGETTIAGSFRAGDEAFYAADGAAELAMHELGQTLDWNAVLAGGSRSRFADGAPSGTRRLADGTTVDLGRTTNWLNCNRATLCSDAEMNAITEDRPWGTNNPRWVLYAFGPYSGVSPSASVNSGLYVAVWVADDRSEIDGNPLVDGDELENPGRGVLELRSEAYGPQGSHRMLEMTVGHARPAGAAEDALPRILRLWSWRQVRGGHP